MTTSTDQLLDLAQKLDPNERLTLVERILGSLDEADPVLDGLWLQEADRRLAAYRSGELRAIPLTEVLARYRST